MSKTIVIYHRADFDGIFCREIARKFLPPDTEFIGWDHGDAPVDLDLGSDRAKVYVLDLPLDSVFGFKWDEEVHSTRFASFDVLWIDHHKSAIDSHPKDIAGYRIDGVAACRLAWQWFDYLVKGYDGHRNQYDPNLPAKQEFIDRSVEEPVAVRLAGEYDIWDKRDPDADTFQFGLRSRNIKPDDWKKLLCQDERCGCEDFVKSLLSDGLLLQHYQRSQDESLVNRGFTQEFCGLNFLCLNIARCNSLTFESAALPEHDGLMGFYWDGKQWCVSLYHSPHHKEHDLSAIAVKYGGGGHRGACGFRVSKLPFIT